MNDSCKKAVLLSVAGGYLLGRTKKAKLVLILGTVFAGRRLGLDPQEWVSQGLRKLSGAPQFEALADQAKDEVLTAARAALSAIVNRRLESLNDSLRGRVEGLRGNEEEEGEESGEEPEEDSAEGRAEEDEEEPEEAPRKKPAKRAPAKPLKKPGGPARSAAGRKSSPTGARTKTRPGRQGRKPAGGSGHGR